MRTLSIIGCVLIALSGAGCRVAIATTDPGVPPSTDAGVPPIDAEVTPADAPCADPSCAPLVEECVPEPGDDFCPAYAAERCAAEIECCTDPIVRPASFEECVRATTCECVSLRAGGAAEEGLGELDDAAAGALLSRLRAAAPGCAVVAPYELSVESAFRGTLGEGEDCSPNEGEESFHACSDGLYCEVTSVAVDAATASGACRRYALAGEACETAECAADAYCGEDGVCHARAGDGAPCASDEECESDACDLDTGTCAVRAADDVWCAYGRSIDDDDEEDEE